MRLAVVLALVMVPAIALAKPKVAFVPIDNDEGGVQEAVVDALDGSDLDIIAPTKVARAEDKLGLEGDLSERDAKKLGKELEAGAVVQATLSTKGANKVLHFRLFAKGKKLKGFKIEFGSAKSAKFKKALREKLVEKLGDVGSSGGGDDDEDKPKKKKKGDKKGGGDDDENPLSTKKGDDEDKPRKKKGGDDDDSAAKRKKGGDDDDDTAKKKKHGDDDDEDKPKKRSASSDDDEGGGGGDDDSVHAHVDLDGGGRAGTKYAMRVDAGISVTGRSLTFNSRPFTEGVGAPKPYSNTPVPGARVEGEMYPLAFGNPNSPAAGLGIGGAYDRTFSLTLHNALQPTTAFPATEFRWQIGVRYRIAFGKKSTSPTLTLGVDYGHRQFKVDRSNQMGGVVIDIPDVQYVGVIPNALLRLPLGSAVSIILGGGSLLATSAGSIQNPEEYGQAKVTSFEAMGGLDIAIGKKFAVRLTGDFGLYGFVFTGNGQMANARDGDPSTPDVGGASDRYIGGAATFAVMY